MSSPVAEVGEILQSMLGLKPPGVTGGKISSITALCNANIQVRSQPSLCHTSYRLGYMITADKSPLSQSEDVLIQRIFTHFKKAPASHKLGVLYVVDSVTRAWVEQAKKAGQAFGPSVPDGTFAAGVNRVTSLLPSIMNDIINTAPDEHKVRSLEGSEAVAQSFHALAVVAMLACELKRQSPSSLYENVMLDSRIILSIRRESSNSLSSGPVRRRSQRGCSQNSNRNWKPPLQMVRSPKFLFC